MLEGGEEGVVGELQHVYVKQDLDQSPEGPKANLASEGKTRIISPSFLKKYCNYRCYDCAFMFQEFN
jgi:hypothetical protein